VSARQIFDPDEFASDGIFVTSSNTSGGGYQSSIVITGEGIRFLFDVLEGMPFPVVCLEVRDQVNIVDADMRRVLIYSTPPPPNDLQVVPTSTLLLYSLEWVRPRSVDECVPINYRVTITNLETNASSFEGVSEESFTYNDTDSDLCQLHEFQVVSTNDAGPGQPVSIRVTLPISPNVEPVSSSLMALPLLDDGVKIQVMFEPATTCNETAHPIVNYIISISELPEVTMNVTHTGSSISAILSSNLLQDDLYTITVSACSAFTCHPAQPVTVTVDPCDGLVCGEGSECQIFEPTGEAFCNPNCEDLNPCGPHQVCKLQLVNCVRAPCPPVLLCEDRVSFDVQLSESGVVVRVEAVGAESLSIIVRDSSYGRHIQKVVGSSASVEFPDLPSGLTSVRANVKLGRGNRVRTEWEEIMVP
jgi:hypothetical protein